MRRKKLVKTFLVTNVMWLEKLGNIMFLVLHILMDSGNFMNLNVFLCRKLLSNKTIVVTLTDLPWS